MTDVYAPTLRKLREAIELAIRKCGEDAEWHGFDDESLVISSKTDPRIMVIVSPRLPGRGEG